MGNLTLVVNLQNDHSMENVYLLWFIPILIIIIFALSAAVRKYRKRYRNNNNRIKQLNSILDVLNQKSETEIYIYNLATNTIYRFADGGLCEIDRNLFDMRNLLHPEDLSRYEREYNLAVNGRVSSRSSIYRLLDTTSNQYLDYEFAITPIEIDDTGKVAEFMFSKKNVTKMMTLMRTQKRLLDTLKFSMSSINFFYWYMDVATGETKAVDNEFNPITLTLEDIIQRGHPDDRNRMREFYNDILKSCSRTSITIRYKSNRDTDYTIYEISASAKCDKKGKPVTLYGVIKDVSDTNEYKTQLSEKVNILEAIKEDLPLGMAFFDKDGVLREVNNKHVELLGTKKTINRK